MKLFAVHMSLIVTCRSMPGHGARYEVADSRKLAVIAEDAAQARDRAINWLAERVHTAERRQTEFHQGHYSEIIAVHLLAGSELLIAEADQGVVRL